MQLWLHSRCALTETCFSTTVTSIDKRLLKVEVVQYLINFLHQIPLDAYLSWRWKLKLFTKLSWNAPVSWEGSLFWNAALQAPTVFRGLRISLKNADTGTLHSC